MQRELLHSPLLVPAGLAVVFGLLFLVERLHPLRQPRRALLQRVFVNLCFSALAFLAGATVTGAIGRRLADWTADQSFGLVPWLPIHPVAKFCLGFLLMDLTFYWWHRVNHRLPVLWRFHNVHHCDPDMDVTTSFRFHVVEILYSSVFRVVQVGLIGVAPLTYVVYEAVFTVETMFHHSNFRLPIRFERWLNRILVTPRMHGIHHSNVEQETNSNYSVIFRWWDQIHRTLRLNVPHAQIRIGVAGHQAPEDNRLWSLLVLPFRAQGDYWTLPDGTRAVREAAVCAGSVNRMME